MPIPAIHVVVPVWGRTYVQCFLDVGLPSLLSPKNLPGLPPAPRNVLQLFTTASDFSVIENSPVWKFSNQIVDCRVEILSDATIRGSDPHALMSECHRKGIQLADAAAAAIIFFNPDIVLADGGMVTLVRLLQAGKRAVQVIGLRLQKEAVVPELLRNFTTKDGVELSVSSRDLLNLAMPNLHPITKMHIDGAWNLDIMPQESFWLAGERGIVARCFHIHPILVYPTVRFASFSSTVDDDYLRTACPNPNDEYVISDSDEFCLCELSSSNRVLSGLPRRRNYRDVCDWASKYARPHHLEHFARRIFLHTDGIVGPEWDEARRRSDDAVKRVFDYLCQS